LFGTEIVNCVSWDDFAKKHDLIGRVSMMKIDVEGWESRVLEGGYKVLSREDSPILQVEFTEEASRAAGSSCKDTYKLLEELGYKMFIYNPTSNKLIPDPLRERYPYMNIIAAKRIDHIVSRLQENS